jgi:iron complex outermembrane receptor protein
MKRNVDLASFDLKKQANKILLLMALSIIVMSVSTMRGSEFTTAAQTKLTGKVADAFTGAPLEGAIVKVKGAETMVVTDKDGKYSFELPKDAKSIIIVSFPGYLTLEIAIEGRAEVNVAMSKVEEDPSLWGL